MVLASPQSSPPPPWLMAAACPVTGDRRYSTGLPVLPRPGPEQFTSAAATAAYALACDEPISGGNQQMDLPSTAQLLMFL